MTLDENAVDKIIIRLLDFYKQALTAWCLNITPTKVLNIKDDNGILTLSCLIFRLFLFIIQIISL